MADTEPSEPGATTGYARTETNRIGFQIASSLADAFRRPSHEFITSLRAALENDGLGRAVGMLRDVKELPFPGISASPELFDILKSINVSGLSPDDALLVRRHRIVNAQILGAHDVAGADATALLCGSRDQLPPEDIGILLMVRAVAQARAGNTEAAISAWKGLLKSPGLLDSTNRGWAWRNLAIAQGLRDTASRSALRCSADAFLEAGLKAEASKSLMQLVDLLILFEPHEAVRELEAVVRLADDSAMPVLQASARIERAKRLAKLGLVSEAADAALEGVSLGRQAVGDPTRQISWLHEASHLAQDAGRTEVANELRQDADQFASLVDSRHFELAHRIEMLMDAFDIPRAEALLVESVQQRNVEASVTVRLAIALSGVELPLTERIEHAEHAIRELDLAGVPDRKAHPANMVMAKLLSEDGQAERAEVWLRKVLDADPWHRDARAELINSLGRREAWSEQAECLQEIISLQGKEGKPNVLWMLGRALLRADRPDEALAPLNSALDMLPVSDARRDMVNETREQVLRSPAVPVARPQLIAPRVLTSKDLEKALKDFSHFVSSKKRMDFWTNKGGADKHAWVTNPERHAQTLLHTHLDGKFGELGAFFEELDSGAGRLDLYVTLSGGLSAVLELKMCGGGYSSNYAALGEFQLLHYMASRRTNLGYLVIFDGRIEECGKKVLPAVSAGPMTITEISVDLSPRISKRRRPSKQV